LATLFYLLSLLLFPFVWLFEVMAKFVSGSLGLIDKARPRFTEDILVSAVKESAREGSIKKIEKEIVTNVFRFDRVPVREIMTPRTDMVTVNVKNKIKDIIDFIIIAGHSRIPVYEKKRDNIVGVLYIKDIMKNLKQKKLDVPVRSIMRKPFFVPESKTIDTLLSQFQKSKSQQAIVVDEHGGTAGLITLEDIIEEIVGGLQDEFEAIEAEKEVEILDERTFVVSGSTGIDEINELVGADLQSEEFHTIGGILFGLFGHLPFFGQIKQLHRGAIGENQDNRRYGNEQYEKRFEDSFGNADCSPSTISI